MRIKHRLMIIVLACLGLLSISPRFVVASYITVDILSLTLSARALPDLSLPPIVADNYTHFPFYFRVNYAKDNNMNWAVELYSNNAGTLGGQTTSDGLYRGLRCQNNVNQSIPLFWQVYNYDLNVAATWGTPNSITLTAGELAISNNTRRYWGEIYDFRDVDRNPTGTTDDERWNTDREDRLVVSVENLGSYPRAGREVRTATSFIYFAGDFSSVTNQDQYVGALRLDYIFFPFDVTKGCFATPNPVKPMLGQRVYFNFFTNSPSSNITIKIYDPTGYPVVTLRNTRYWDCRNANYQYVEGGLYLYQIEVEGHRLSGTVVVIK